MVFGAGNSGIDLDPTDGTSMIANCEKNVITVGAVNQFTGQVTNFSSRGPTADGRIKPDLVAPGAWDVYQPDSACPTCYQAFAGTSAAAPFVSGLVADLLEYYTSWLGKPEGVKAGVLAAALPVSGQTGRNNEAGS